MAKHYDTDNYFILLELPFDSAEVDSSAVKAALHGKKQEWTRLQNNPGKRGMALKFLDLVPDIERTMLDPVLRARQAKAARELQLEMQRRMEAELRVLEAKGYLTPKEITSVAVKYRSYGIEKRTVEECARCPVGEGPPRPGRGQEPDEPEPLDRITARAIERALAVLGQKDLYAFLELAPYSSIQKLVDAAEDKRKQAQKSADKNAKVTATQELAGICKKVFADFNAKQRYDRYLKVSKYPALGELIDEEFSRAGHISADLLLRLVNFAVETYRVGVLDAEEYIRAYCSTYDIPLNAKSRTIPCPGCGIQMARQAPVCTSCAAPLRGECPGCGTHFAEGTPLCAACGFNLGNMVHALRYIDDAQNAIIENNWGTAQRNVQYAKKYWPGHPQIEPLEKRAASLEDRYAWYAENVADCVQHNQYYAALELVEESRARRIRLPQTIVEHVERVIRDFERRLDDLTNGGKEPAIQQLLELGIMVGDSIELSRLLKQHPPQSPVALQAALSDQLVHLKWEPSPSPGILEYVVVRKTGAKPLTAFDGETIYQGRGTACQDSGTEPLTEYYYSVFTGRGGAYSLAGASAGPVLRIPEIEGLRIVPSDMGAQFTWDFNPHIKEVGIWRKLGGDRPTAPGEGIRLDTPRIDGFTDSKIKNDVEYWYFLVAAYIVDGRKVYSKGVCDSVIPHKFVAPPEQLFVAASDVGDHEYVASWDSGEDSDVLLLVSPEPPEHHTGDILPVEHLMTRYKRLDATFKGDNSARFRYPFSGGVYIFAATVFGRFAAVSQSFYLIHVPDIQNPSYDVLGDDLFLNLEWPGNLPEVIAAYRLDRYPLSPDEIGATALRTTREQFQANAAVVLHEPEAAIYYVKLFAVFPLPDGGRAYSAGTELLVDNTVQQDLYYEIRHKKKLLGKSCTLSFTVSSGERFRLPKAVFVGKVGRLPLSKVDGVSLFEIDRESNVEGEITFTLETDPLPDDLYLRMFLHDDSGYANYHLLPQGAIRIT